jgi:hypothetical protein
MRYHGEGYESEVPLPSTGDADATFGALAELFETEVEAVIYFVITYPFSLLACWLELRLASRFSAGGSVKS